MPRQGAGLSPWRSPGFRLGIHQDASRRVGPGMGPSVSPCEGFRADPRLGARESSGHPAGCNARAHTKPPHPASASAWLKKVVEGETL